MKLLDLLKFLACENREHCTAIFELTITPLSEIWQVELDDGLNAYCGEADNLDAAVMMALRACRDKWLDDLAGKESDIADNLRESAARMTALIEAAP
jgi:hypothetical protein